MDLITIVVTIAVVLFVLILILTKSPPLLSYEMIDKWRDAILEMERSELVVNKQKLEAQLKVNKDHKPETRIVIKMISDKIDRLNKEEALSELYK